jgi:hypothetical protein
MPRYVDIRSTVLTVVGYGILPEEEDRPGAYDLKRGIVSRGLGVESRGAVVVDQDATREAVQRFMKDGFLDRFLDTVWKRTD